MRGSMATVNIMAAEVPASELELEEDDEELLIEALRRHLTYVESRLAEISHQIQDNPPPVVPEVTGTHRLRGGKKKETLHVRPTVVEEPVPSRPKLPRASELTRLPHKPKPVLSEKEKEKLQKEAAAKKKQDMQYLSVLNALELLKRDYRDRYLELMQLQVRDQQRRVREKDVEWEKKLAQRKERDKKQRLQRKPRVFRSSAVADYSFLDNVHQGVFYKIVSLEMELRNKGVLKSLQDLQTFWGHMLSKESERGSSAVVAPADREQQAVRRAHTHQHRVAESQVLEEEDEEDSSHSWAITAVPRTDRGPSAGKQVGSLQTKREDTQSGPSFRFQPAEPPQFKSLHQLLRSSSWEEKQETQRHTAKVRAMQKKTRMVEHMFDVARANEQVTARLLEHLDIDLMFDELPPPLEYLPLPSTRHHALTMAVVPSTTADGKETEEGVEQGKEEEVEDREEKVVQRTEEVPVGQLGVLTQVAVGEECVSDGGSRDNASGGALVVAGTTGRSSSTELTSPMSEGRDQPTSSSPPPPLPCIPLTMESLMVVGDVKAAKSTSMWSNYLLAGR